MLVLNRKLGEEIHNRAFDLSDDNRDVVANLKIGVDAPREMSILRGELKQKNDTETSV